MCTFRPTVMDSITLSVVPCNPIVGDRWRRPELIRCQVPAGTRTQQRGDVVFPWVGTPQCHLRCSWLRALRSSLPKQLQRTCHSCNLAGQVLKLQKQMITMDQNRSLCGPVWANGNLNEGGTAESISARASEDLVWDLKRTVISTLSNTNRGKDITYQLRQEILKQLEELEELNPTANPIESHLFSGSWALLYTSPVNEKTADKYAGTEEGPFLARIKPFAFGFVRQIRSIQVLDANLRTASNIADFVAFGVKGSLNIKGTVTKAAPMGKGAKRVDVTFESFVLKFGDWKTPAISLRWINPKGWIDTTFLDKDMRIGRGDKGSIFVAVRMKEN